jgi:hypothetical protein
MEVTMHRSRRSNEAHPGNPGGAAALLLVTALLGAPARPAAAQASNEILQLSPDTAPQGTVGLTVTFTLDSDAPPAPPAGILPTGVTLGGLNGTGAAHQSQYLVSAVFDIPAGEPTGPHDAAVVFPTPDGGTLTFTLAGAFTVTAAGGAPVIGRDPLSRQACLGGTVVFSVAASGEPPLSYRWQKDGIELPGATASTYTIAAATAGDQGDYRAVVDNALGTATSRAATLAIDPGPCAGRYPVVDTGQAECYDTSTAVACPATGSPYHGQDAQFAGLAPGYTVSGDGLTVHDDRTGLDWTRSTDRDGDGSITARDKLDWAGAQAWPAELNAARFGGFDDWRLPTIQELYSLIDFRGVDPSGFTGDPAGLIPFLDTGAFDFAYGDTAAGERIIDSQYASRTLYVSHTHNDAGGTLFGVNFADGRIKGYGLTIAGRAKTFYVIAVRGRVDHGRSDLVDNGDGTVTDRSTGLMWSRADSGVGLDWPQALGWVAARNAERWLNHDDWRLPNAKELHTIVDYSRSPDTTGSAAIDPVLAVSEVRNEAGQVDYPCYWTGTTHASWTQSPGAAAVYLAFGRAMGYLDGAWHDVHGAGAQRSDPKEGDPAQWPTGNGPQGDAIRIYNFVRPVRDAAAGPGHAVLRLALADPAERTALLPLDPVRDLYTSVAAGPLTVAGDALAASGPLCFYRVPDAVRLDVVRRGDDVTLDFAF